jgi:uncharacterized protein involved in outer membrane biogenesis
MHPVLQRSHQLTSTFSGELCSGSHPAVVDGGWGLNTYQLAGARVDLLARRLDVTRLPLAQPMLALSRRAEGELNVARWLQPVVPAATRGKPAAAPNRRPDVVARPGTPWRLALHELSVTGARLAWTDATVTAASTEGPLRADVSALTLRLQDLA